MVLTPEPVSDADTVAVALPMYAPSASCWPSSFTEVSGGVVSSVGARRR